MANQRVPGPLGSYEYPTIDDGTLIRKASFAPGILGHDYNSQLQCEKPDSDEGLTVVLTPIQLASILENQTIEASGSLKERFWGAATAVAGAMEMVGAAALLLVPEPTSATKIAGAALGAHGIDTASTGIRQILSGRSEATFTSQAVESTATSLGVDEANARKIGITVDIAIPILTGVAGALRVISIRRGAISLAAEEAAGGHTILKHIGRTEAQLNARLVAEPRVMAATTFRTLAEAERFVAEALRANKAAISEWAKTAAVGQTKAFPYATGRVLGVGVQRGSQNLKDATRMVVVLRKTQIQDRVYFVLTSYPKF
jgi:hypothetical protein